MKKNRKRIGIFDSGIGGITVLKEILSLAPDADVVYLGDCARLPYGTKSSKTIIRYSLQCARFLVSKDIDMLVVACNTASSHSLPALQEALSIPVVGVVASGSRAAIDAGGKKIGVIGTPSTIRSKAYDTALRAIRPDVRVFSRACPLFVPLVEEGWCNDAITEQVAHRYLDGLLSEDIDTLLLGCTHYPLLKNVLSKVAGDGVCIVDSAVSTARVVAGLNGNHPSPDSDRSVVYYLSDVSERFIELGEVFLGQKMEYVYEIDLCV
jgi:glutamate racemase